ncbi:integrase domain-containing protein [Gilliamella sp. Pas-s27]|uniref:integrase domain-containing protein n=1 Tax=Gilliamella sp. Pas-s27 TaxID=2687311 RepID=UPI0013657B4E|nr:integrase domain-containing protein [Gilliamella sp. Pas-s27]MWP46907.1 tyrosine-type recombinase/integrase [Gilliamella sp. Pas-s27]
MVKIVKPLTDTQIKNAKPKEKDYTLSDGDGLYLLIKKTGSKIWRFNYIRPSTKKRALISFGHYPQVSLIDARNLRNESRDLIRQNKDPLEKELINTQKIRTLKSVADDWLILEKSQGYKDETIKKSWQSLENHVFPYLGNTLITDITPTLFINILAPLKAARKFDMIKRVIRRVNKIMDYAVNYELIESNKLIKVGKVFESPTPTNMPSIRPDELPEFMQALSLANIELQTRCLIEWQLLTITRPSEAVGALWEEIDIKQRIWTIPASKMKMKRDHIIPLPYQAIKILEIMLPITSHKEFVFPSMKGSINKPMSSQTVNMAIKRMGFDGRLVSHGLRSLASTALNEQGFNPDLIEASLAHADKNEVRSIYNRANYLEQRRELMNWWGDFVEQASQGNVSLSGSNALKTVND